MQIERGKINQLLMDSESFVVPIYQRTYNWEKKHCQQLWDDIEKIIKNEKEEKHFIGSIVRKEPDEGGIEIVDGQQRITTMLLLIAALLTKVEKGVQEWVKYDYLKKNDKYKLILHEPDREMMEKIIDGEIDIEGEEEKEYSGNLVENYRFFLVKIGEIQQIDRDKIQAILKNLQFSDIILNKEDNPQQIFESMNSTGLPLDDTDRIRNYVLMGSSKDDQHKLYGKYWKKMEEEFGRKNSKVFKQFFRHFLMAKHKKNVKLTEVYDVFKKYFEDKGGNKKAKGIMEDISKQAGYYVNMVLAKEKDEKLKSSFYRLKDLNFKVVYPFLLNVYSDCEGKRIDKQTFLQVLDLLESFLLRRAICEIRTQGLDLFFASLYNKINNKNSKINKKKYLKDLELKFALEKFPNDDDFKENLTNRDMYHFKHKKYFLCMLDWNRGKERGYNISGNPSIEHIMPQKIDGAKEGNQKEWQEKWQGELGDDWKEDHPTWLHTLGNLTWTGYNPEISNRPFQEKKAYENGLNKTSPYRLNETVCEEENWNAETIKKRARTLAEDCIKLWKYPDIDEKKLERGKKTKEEERKKEKEENWEKIKERYRGKKGWGDLYSQLREQIFALDSDDEIEEAPTTSYIAYKINGKNFVEVAPQTKQGLQLHVDIDFGQVTDKNNRCEDASNKGRRGTGNVRLNLDEEEQLDDVMDIVRQSFDNQTGNQED